MKKKLLVVLLCVVVGIGSFIAGCVVTGLSWRSDADKMADRIAELEETLASAQESIVELTTEVTLYEMDMKKLEILYGIDVEELLGE